MQVESVGGTRRRSLNLRAWGTMFGVAMLLGGLPVAGAQSSAPPPLVFNQTNWLAPLPSNGRVITGANAAGTSFAVNANGEVAVGDTFGNQVTVFNGQTGATEKAWAFRNPGAVAVDNQGNLYVATVNTNWIVKLPYTNGTYADLTTDPQTTPPPACTGTDTAECAWGISLQGNGAFGFVSMTFDAHGNLFYATNGRGAVSNQWGVFECSVASGCIGKANTGSGSGGAALKLFAELPGTASTYCSGAKQQTAPGSVGVDPWGNVFFTESVLDTSTANCNANASDPYPIDQSDSSAVRELALVGGSYAAPVTLYTFTPAHPSAYDDQVSSVVVDAKGTVYFSTHYDGVVGFANDGTPFTGPVPQADLYGVWTYPGWINGAKALSLGEKGNLYVVTSFPPASGSARDTLGRVSLNSLPFGASPVGTGTGLTTPASITSVMNVVNSAMVMVNDADCSSVSVGVVVTENGSSTSEFAGGPAPANCANSTFFGGQSSLPLTLTFTPFKVGTRSAVVTAIDEATGNEQKATASGVGQGGLVALDSPNNTVALTGFVNPAGIAVDAAGNLFVADASKNAVDKIAAGSQTLSPMGSGLSTPSGVALDANGDLYIADSGNNRIVEIPSATGTPGAQVTAVSSSATFGGAALNGPTGLAMGADGVLYISDTGNNRVVTYNPANEVTGVRATGLSTPAGIAVDAADTLYVANAGSGSGGNVEVFPGGGGAVTTLTVNGAATPLAVAVDASGSVLISDGQTGAIVRVPNESGVLTAADAMTIAQNPMSGGGVALDAAGNLYAADVLGATVYTTQRTAATIDFGSVQDGSSAGPKTVLAENAGNLPLTSVGGSFLTQPASGNFVITAGSPNDCGTAASLASGLVCEFNASFAPAPGTASGDLTDTADFNSTAVNPTAVITLQGTAVFVPPPGFSIAVTPSSLSVKAGGSGTATVTVTPQGGFNSEVTFSCSGLPAGAACSFSPASVTPSGNTSSPMQLTVTTAATSAALDRGSSPLFPGGAALACVMFFCFGLRKRRGLLTVLLLAASLTGLGMLSGCGVHVPPKAVTATVTVNGLSGTMQSSATFNLTIQP